MNINIKTTNIELTEAIEEYLQTKLDYLKKFISKDQSGVQADVEIGKTTEHHRSGEVYRAEINLEIPGMNLFRAEATAEDLYAAIDKVKDEMAKQIKSKKSKHKDLLKKGGRRLKNMWQKFRGE
ncbi:MAG: ribosome hibernation-promoting factor, HPF/YfiA family [Patescibacteria group bacterium]|jgi:putative sigma-54 modulation protein